MTIRPACRCFSCFAVPSCGGSDLCALDKVRIGGPRRSRNNETTICFAACHYQYKFWRNRDRIGLYGRSATMSDATRSRIPLLRSTSVQLQPGMLRGSTFLPVLLAAFLVASVASAGSPPRSLEDRPADVSAASALRIREYRLP